jgi:hypothetical protein
MKHPLAPGNPEFSAIEGKPRSFLRIEKLRHETLVFSYSAAGWYEVRRLRSAARRRAALAGPPITENEFEELAALRKAQGWGAPLFQPGHSKYRQALAR